MRWLLIHSSGDTLVEMSQSDAIYSRLKALDASVEFKTHGFTEEHDDVLKSEVYIAAIMELVVGLDKLE